MYAPRDGHVVSGVSSLDLVQSPEAALPPGQGNASVRLHSLPGPQWRGFVTRGLGERLRQQPRGRVLKHFPQRQFEADFLANSSDETNRQ
jgi:hypothetical protein